MTDDTLVKGVECPECGAANDPGREKCWLCGSRVAEGDWVPQGTARPAQFGLSSLFLVITLVCVCLGLASIAPGLLIPLLVLVVPALVRTLSASQRLSRRGKSMTTGDKLAAFFTSLALVVLIGVAGFVAFFAACLAGLGVISASPSSSGGSSEMTVVLTFLAIGGIGAVAVMVLLGVKTWPGNK